MYSLMSIRIRASESANRNSASARPSSVFPTPVGPEKMKEPIGLRGSLSPARLLRIARLTASIASCWPTILLWSSSSIWTSRSNSVWRILVTGIPVHRLTINATSSGEISGRCCFLSSSHSSCLARISLLNSRSSSRSSAARSKS